jgi:DNA-binding LacI/PurR family transcriptional regulator
VAIVSFPEYALDDPALCFDLPRERAAGYRAGLGDAWDRALVLTAHSNRPDTGRELFAQLRDIDPRHTAVLAMSDALAAGIVRAAVDAGVRVPGDLSVVGFDGVPLGALTDPPLTTVVQPTEHKGELAVRALLEMLERGDAGAITERTILPTELLVRGTTAPPRA